MITSDAHLNAGSPPARAHPRRDHPVSSGAARLSWSMHERRYYLKPLGIMTGSLAIEGFSGGRRSGCDQSCGSGPIYLKAKGTLRHATVKALLP
jgi:hypothetical protein